MKQILLLILAFATITPTQAQTAYWQQRCDYRIDLRLDAAERSLEGYETIQYTNNSPDTLNFIWFHLWPNAYKTDRTAFTEQMLKLGDTRSYFSDAPERGYIHRLQFTVNGQPARTEDHPEHIDIIKLLLPQPLLPGTSTRIATPFRVKLPLNISRGGYYGNSIQASQWFPKPAVYDANGWHPMPYLQLGEYYSEFGSFDVRITAPVSYMVAATGKLQNQVTVAPSRYISSDTSLSIPKILPQKKATGTATQKRDSMPEAVQTWHFRQDSVHDFAWFASPDQLTTTDTCRLASGRVVQVASYFSPARSKQGRSMLHYAKDALRFYSEEIAEYPFETLSVVEGPPGFNGGMEYPGICLIAPDLDGPDLDIVVAHEVGHNWFYGILASNERSHPWLDEGLNSFYENKYAAQRYPNRNMGEALLFHTLVHTKRDLPIETTSELFTETGYGMIPYYKTAEWLKWVEEQAGSENFRSMMQAYYKRWAFRHPAPADLFQLFKEYFPEKAEALWAPVKTTGALSGQELSGFRLLSPLAPKTFGAYLKQPSKQALILTPAFGYNLYDRFMIGALLTNYKLPPSRFQFALAPLYATGTKQLNGIGRAGVTTYARNGFSFNAHIAAASFTYDEFAGEDGKKYYSRFTKLAPGAGLNWRGADTRSTRRHYVNWKSFFIGEQPLRIRYDSVITPTDTSLKQSVGNTDLNYQIHTLAIGTEDDRALYPYRAQLMAQLSQRFSRLQFEGHYFFNYPKGGLYMRVFAGALFEDEHQRSPYGYDPRRFHLNLSAANGSEDYTYRDYFVGRNRFDGWASHQVAIRDGGFKVRSELLNEKIGKSGKWVAAINLNTTIPKKINPLSVLPFNLPLLVFADIGTYAEAWEENAEGSRLLYDAGLQLSLFSGSVNIYLPVFYSAPFRDYYRSTFPEKRLLETISFSIDLDRLQRSFRKQLPL